MFDDFLIWLDNNIRSNDPANVSAAKVRTAFQDVVNTTASNIVMANTGGAIYTLPIEPGSPAITVENTIIPVLTPGTYTNFGGVVLPEGHFGLIFKNGETYAIETTEMPVAPVDGVVEEGNEQAVSGGAVFKSNEKLLNKTDDLFESFNAFNKNTIIDGFYIDNTTGVLTPYAQASVSDWIDVKGWTVGYLSGKNSGVANSVRFKDENGTILKPIDSTGNPLAIFNIGFSNGLVYIPTTAVAFQFTATFQTFSNISRVQFEKGNIQTNYKEYGIGILNKSLLNSDLRVEILADDINVRSDFNGIIDIFMTLNKSVSNNKLFNIYTAKIIGKNDLDTATGLALNGASHDDAAPPKLNDTYIGANHGALGALVVNVASHNKTLADVGSRWVDNEGQIFVLLRILSPTQLFVISTNRGVGTWNFKGGIAGVLTYVSNGTNTSVITPINTLLSQLYPAVKNIKHTYILDGEIKTDGTHNGKELVVAEFYDIVDVPSMLDNLTNNRPVGGYTVQPTLTDGDTLATINNNYIITKGCNVVLEWNISIKKQCKFERYGAVQAEYIKPSWVTNYNRFYPNSLPINGYDFRLPTAIDGAYTAEMNLTSAYWEDINFPVIRSVDRLNGSNRAINFNIGYLPIMSQANRKDQINNAWWMWTSKKQYPNAIDNKIGSVLAVGETRAGVAFRGWSDGITDFYNKHKVVYNEDIYYFLDVFSVGIFRFSDDELIGKKIEVVYKTDNVNLLTELTSGYVDIQSIVKSPQYGNIILKIS